MITDTRLICIISLAAEDLEVVFQHGNRLKQYSTRDNEFNQ